MVDNMEILTGILFTTILFMVIETPLMVDCARSRSSSTSSTSSSSSSSGSFDCDLKKLDQEALKLTGTLSSMEYPYPLNDQELKDACREGKQAHKYFKEFANTCKPISPSTKSILTVFVYTNSQVNKKYCSPSKKNGAKSKAELYRMGECVNPLKKSVIKCYQNFLNTMNVTHRVTPSKDKMTFMCCTSIQMRDCIIDVLRKKDPAKCNEEVLEDFRRLFDANSGNLFNLSCENFDDQTDTCTPYIRKHLERLNYKSTNDLPKSPWKSPFSILFYIFDTL